MRFGTFAPLRRAPGENDDAQVFSRGLSEVQYAERLGYDDVWMAEAYFLNVLGISSLQQVTWFAGQTERVRLGTAICAMPLHSPLEVAITASNADHMSGGRFDLGFGRGFSPLLVPESPPWSDGFVGLGNPKLRPQDYPKDGLKAKYLESIACVKGLLENEEFTFKGDFYEFDGCWLHPRPKQQPVPLWAVAQQLSSYEEMGELGYNLLIPLPGYHGNFQTWEGTADALKAYRAAWKKAGNPGDPEVIVRTQLCLSEKQEDAWDIARVAYTTMDTETIFEDSALKRTIGGDSSLLALGFLGGTTNPNVQAIMTMTVDDVIEQTTITGTPAFAVEQIKRIQEEFGASGVIVESISILNGKRPDYWHTLQLCADEVMPHFK